jgi:hypothetical protein
LGKEFFPYTLPIGSPVHVKTQSDIAHALFERNVAYIAKEDAGIESEDEREIEPPSPRRGSSTIRVCGVANPKRVYTR